MFIAHGTTDNVYWNINTKQFNPIFITVKGVKGEKTVRYVLEYPNVETHHDYVDVQNVMRILNELIDRVKG